MTDLEYLRDNECEEDDKQHGEQEMVDFHKNASFSELVENCERQQHSSSDHNWYDNGQHKQEPDRHSLTLQRI